MKKENELSEKNLEQVSGGAVFPSSKTKLEEDGVTPAFVSESSNKPDDDGVILITTKVCPHGCND